MSIGDYLPKREFLLSKKFFTILAFVFGASFLIWAVYLYNPKFVPETVRVANDKIVDTVVGKDLAKAIDTKRDTDGAVTIRELFNTNKEQNLEKHCEKKFEQGKEQEKCYKKYVNEEFGYSFNYPINWNSVDKTEELKVEGALGKDVLLYQIFDSKYTSLLESRIHLEIKKSMGKELDIENSTLETVINERKTIFVSGMEGTLIKGEVFELGTGKLIRKYDEVLVNYEDKVLDLGYVRDVNDAENLSDDFENIYESLQIK